ncbi:hypothetical protein AG4045_028131 [Apium graveolens]|uniref:TF-B3 domain-containing protein n=1 Tax=Apium graveolens TaxID=4045 RepID=A0A6L5B6S5_APIGR|nr:hypothetical protein AG4045_028131 [Apium graveolens]
MDLNPRFERRLRISECTSNAMRVPHAFCEKYGHRIPSTVRVLVCNGYELWVDFDKVSEKFRGLGDFFHEFGMKSGNTLIFQYGGDFDVKVCILDIYGSEIQYPPMVHNLQTCAPSNVSIFEGGWSFVRYLGWGGKVCDSVYVPYEFDDQVGALIPERVDFVVSSGYKFIGKYCCSRNSLSHLTDLNGCTAFEIVIQKFHLLPHEHGVDILVEFKELSNHWLKKDHISTYVGIRCWLLEIRRRRDKRRCTINGGWLMFREDLHLDVGDTCTFQWRDDSIRNFNVVVQKRVVDLD